MKFRLRLFATAFFIMISSSVHSQKEDRELFKNASCYYEYALKRNNDPFYLSKSDFYCDQAIKKSSDTQLIASLRILKNKIALKFSTCEQNMNHQFEFFSFFKGVPSTYGFADDNIEYSFEHALDDLLELPYYTASKSVGEVNGYALLRRGNTDEEMYDINFQQLSSSVNQYLLPHHIIADLIGPQNLETVLSDGDSSELLIGLICHKLGINEIGVYEGNFIHQVDDLIQTEFRFNKFTISAGLADPLVIFGYSIDKRGVLLKNGGLLLLSSLLLILVLQFFEYLFDQRKRLSLNTVGSYFEWKSFKDKLTIAILSQLIPMIIGLILIQSLSFLTPEDSAHYLEGEAILWYVTNTLVLALIPTLLSFFIVNKLNVDGFHTLRGYQIFATASLYGSLSPLFIWSVIKYAQIPHDIHLVVLLNTVFIGMVFGKSMELFFKRKRSDSNRIIGIAGTLIVTISAFITAWLLIHVLSLREVVISTTISFVFTVLFYAIFKFSKSEKSLFDVGENLVDLSIPYTRKVVEAKTITAKIVSSDTTIGVIHGMRGIGKTSYIKEILTPELKGLTHEVFYADCDQFTDKNGLHFEPFVEAFGDFLGVDEIEDKSSIVGNVTSAFPFGIIDDRIGQLLTHSGRPREKTGEDFVIEVLDKLVGSKSSQIYFILEDVQWIDNESKNLVLFMLGLLEHRKYKKVLGSRFKFIFTYSDGIKSASEEFRKEIDWIPKIGFEIDFNQHVYLNDYILHLGENENFKLSESAKNSLNNVFNELLTIRNHITPKFINQQISTWYRSNVLTPSASGLQLSEVVNSEEIPNGEDLTEFYDGVLSELPSIINTDKQKTIRILESAAYLGRDFDIKILSDLWNIDLLDLLDYFSILESKDLAADVPGKDNQYSFVDPNFILALKNYFGEQIETDQHRKQIVIEYHKRWINLRLSSSQDIDSRSTEELQELLSKFQLIRHSDEMKELYYRVISNIAIRFFLMNEFQKVKALLDVHGKFMDGFLFRSLRDHLYFWEFSNPLQSYSNGLMNSKILNYWKAINTVFSDGLNENVVDDISLICDQDISASELDYCLKIIIKRNDDSESHVSNSAILLQNIQPKQSKYGLLLDLQVITSGYNLNINHTQKIDYKISEILRLISNSRDSSFETLASQVLNNYYFETDAHIEVENLWKLMISQKSKRVDSNWVDFILSINHKTFNEAEYNTYLEQFDEVEQYVQLRNLDEVLSDTSFQLLLAKISIMRKSEDSHKAIELIEDFMYKFKLREVNGSIFKTYLVKLLIQEADLYSELEDFSREKELLQSAYTIIDDTNNSEVKIELLQEYAKFSRINEDNPSDCLRFMKEAIEEYNRNPVLSKKRLGLLYFQTAQAYLALEKWDEALDYYLRSKPCWANNPIGQFRNFIADCRVFYCLKHGKASLPEGYSLDTDDLIRDIKLKIGADETEVWLKKYGGKAAIDSIRPFL